MREDLLLFTVLPQFGTLVTPNKGEDTWLIIYQLFPSGANYDLLTPSGYLNVQISSVQ